MNDLDNWLESRFQLIHTSGVMLVSFTWHTEDTTPERFRPEALYVKFSDRQVKRGLYKSSSVLNLKLVAQTQRSNHQQVQLQVLNLSRIESPFPLTRIPARRLKSITLTLAQATVTVTSNR